MVADSLPGTPVKNQIGFFNLSDGSLQYWKKFRGDSVLRYGTFYNSLISTRDGGFAVTGYTEHPSLPMKALFMKLDSTGEVMFYREYDIDDTTNKFITAEAVLELPNGCLIGGDRTTITSNLYNANIHLLKIDVLGNVKWWKSYGSAQLTEADVSLLQLTDTSYLIGYAKNNWYLTSQWEFNRTQLMIIDTEGNVKNQWFDPYDSSSAPFSLQKTKDGGFAYCGRLKHSQPIPYDYVLFQGGVTKLDSAFNVKWRKRIGFQSDITVLYNLKELQDGSFIAVGSHFSGDDTSNNYSGWFVKLSANGDSIWERKYQSVVNYYEKSDIYDFELLPDGGIIACGLSQDNTAPYQKQQGWLIRLDSMGCLIPGCDTITTTTIKETSDEAVGVKVYPNPAKDMVYILLKSESATNAKLSFSVYNSEGKQIVTERQAYTEITYLLNLEDYTPGMYVIEVTIGEGARPVRRRFIKE